MRLIHLVGLTYDWRVLPATTSASSTTNHPSGRSSDSYSSGGEVSVDMLLRQVSAMSSSSSMATGRGWPLPQELSTTAGATTTVIYDRKSALACLAFTSQASNTHSSHR